METISFIVSQSPTQELYGNWFIAQIKGYMRDHNHPYKFQGMDTVLNIIDECIKIKGLKIAVIYNEGNWKFDCEDNEIERIGELIPLFKRLYRHQPNLKGV